MAAIYIRVPSGAEHCHPLPPGLPVSADQVVTGILESQRREELIMLPDGSSYD